MFSFFKSAEPDPKQTARQLFEKVLGLNSDTHDARNARLRLGMLIRAHVDKTFVAGAEQTATWQERAAVALANGDPLPDEPSASRFQKVKSGETEVYVYLPDEFARDIFALGSKYQRVQITAQQAIDAVQGIVNQLSKYELGLEEPFQALTFLREELAAEAEALAKAAAQAQAGAGSGAASPDA